MRTYLAFVAAFVIATSANAQHQHGKPAAGAPEPFTASPAFGPDGTLWLARAMADRIVVLRSSDLGKSPNRLWSYLSHESD